MAIVTGQEIPHPLPSFRSHPHYYLLERLYSAVLHALRALRSSACVPREDNWCARNSLRVGAAAIGMLGLGVQFATQAGSTINVVEATCRFLCYFTFWTNTIAALSMLVPVLAPTGTLGRFLLRPTVRTVIAANLLVVGLVYHCVLSEPFKPTWAFQADLCLHYIMPVLYLADWFFCVPRTRLAWWTAARSIIVPLVYGIWMFGYGAIAQWYPYPFVEVQTLGIAETLANLFCLLSVFVITTAILILVDRLAHRGEHATANLQLVHECAGIDRQCAAVHYCIGK
jgi:hypothetical protein